MRERAQIFGDEKNLAERIAQVRQERGLSLAQLSELMGMEPPMPTTAIYRIEKGQRSIRVDELLAFGRALDLDPVDLLTPIELLGRQDAERIADRVRRASALVVAAAREQAAAASELRELHTEAPEAGEYLLNLLAAPFWTMDQQRTKGTLPADARSSIEQAADDAASDLISAIWDIAYEGAAERFGYFLSDGSNVVPDPAKPMRRSNGQR